jgi:hypothetical protein
LPDVAAERQKQERSFLQLSLGIMLARATVGNSDSSGEHQLADAILGKANTFVGTARESKLSHSESTSSA